MITFIDALGYICLTGCGLGLLACLWINRAERRLAELRLKEERALIPQETISVSISTPIPTTQRKTHYFVASKADSVVIKMPPYPPTYQGAQIRSSEVARQPVGQSIVTEQIFEKRQPTLVPAVV